MTGRLTITPMAEQCLRAMSRSVLDQHPDGWRPRDGRPGCWNTHTVRTLERRRYCRIITQGRYPFAKILDAGKVAIGQIDMVEEFA